MAEIAQGGGGGHKKGTKVRSKKMSTRIDMTPMVDLAFLLLTFFVLTTTMNKPKTMEIRIPDKEKENDKPIDINEKRVVTLLLGDNDKIYWYPGINPESLQESDYGKGGIRKILEDNETKINAIFGNKEQSMFVFIKPMDEANYKNVVDILDEMKVVDITKYALMEATGQDKNIIQQYAASMGAPNTQ